MPSIRMTMAQYRRRRCELDGQEIRLSRSQREIVALLLIRRGAWVPYEQVATAIWPAAVPDSWRTQIRIYDWRLRNKLPGVIDIWHGVGLRIPRPDQIAPAQLLAA